MLFSQGLSLLVSDSGKMMNVSTLHTFLLHLDKELGRFCSSIWHIRSKLHYGIYVCCWHILALERDAS